MASNYTIIWVAFPKPVRPHLKPALGLKKDWFFTCLAAIYDVFLPAQIGCQLRDLYFQKLTCDSPFDTGKCTIIRTTAINKKQKAHGEDKT